MPHRPHCLLVPWSQGPPLSRRNPNHINSRLSQDLDINEFTAAVVLYEGTHNLFFVLLWSRVDHSWALRLQEVLLHVFLSHHYCYHRYPITVPPHHYFALLSNWPHPRLPSSFACFWESRTVMFWWTATYLQWVRWRYGRMKGGGKGEWKRWRKRGWRQWHTDYVAIMTTTTTAMATMNDVTLWTLGTKCY